MTLRATKTPSPGRGSFVVPAQTVGAVQSSQPTATVPRNTSVRRRVFTPTSDPTVLAADLNALQTNLAQTFTQIRSNPFASSALLQGIAATSGTSFKLSHRLGRVPKGWLAVDAQTAAWTGYRVPPTTGALGPSGGPQEADYLTLMPGATGTYTFLVF